MLTKKLANRIGFIILGLTNNFAYVVMLAAAFDLLTNVKYDATSVSSLNGNSNSKYCSRPSTASILLADTIPSLVIKFSYPFLLVGIPTCYKVVAVAALSASSFIVTGFSSHEAVVFTGVVCASLSSGLGESTFLSNTPHYGDVSLSGWSMGTGAAGLLGAVAYALLRLVLPIKIIMILMLVIPVAMLIAFFYLISPVDYDEEDNDADRVSGHSTTTEMTDDERTYIGHGLAQSRMYGAAGIHDEESEISTQPELVIQGTSLDLGVKVRFLPKLASYFLPLLMVYFAEYFINQGLFELIYYPDMSLLDHAGQYSWLYTAYQLGVMISRSSLDLFKIKRLWVMALLQSLNAIIFLAQAAKLIHIPSFYIVIVIIIYEGLLGGFTYTNTYYRLKKEMPQDKREFAISAVAVSDSIGIVVAGLVALPVHDALCHLYD